MHHDPTELPSRAKRPKRAVTVGVMLTISSGHSADYLLGAVAEGRESYYTGAVTAGEPPGRWYGTGAEALGLSGLVDHQDMRAVYERFIDPRDPGFRDKARWKDCATLGHTGRKYQTAEEIYAASLKAEPHADPERREQLLAEAGTKARSNVAFLDATFSVQKSVTVLHTAFEAQEVAARQAGDLVAADAWAAHRIAVEDAVWAGNNAMLDFLAEKAGYSRVGHHGGAAGRYIDAHDWTIASFFQHDSRDRDPQLHIHNAILNRVLGPDGVWRTLDGRSLYAYRGAAAAVAERVMEEHLTRSLGVWFAARPDGKAREVVGIGQQVMDLFSSRRRAITPKTAELVKAFVAQVGRDPNGLERNRMFLQATLATRKSKAKQGEDQVQRLARWDRQLRAEVAGGLAKVADTVLKLAGKPRPAEAWSEKAVLETALADVQSRKSGWTESDLTRAISDALPGHLGGLTGTDVTRLLEGLTVKALKLAVPLDAERPGDAVLPDLLRLADGRSAYDAPGGKLYATPEHVHTERFLLAATTRRGAPALDTAAANGYLAGLAETGLELGVDQAAAVRGILTSGAAVESLVGPAGTGKSFVLGALADAWENPNLWDGAQHRVVGLATSQVATEVLAGEGLHARNIARWLATQDRLTTGSPVTAEDEAWRLGNGDLVVVDESSMADTANLAAIHGHVQRAGAKLLLTGDHRQLAAVGAGGGMDLLADAGQSYELSEVRRFHSQWERAASLRLRDGDPSVLGEYHRHGRIVDGGAIEQTEAAAGRAWLADTLSGRHSLLLVDTNEQAARLSAQLRAELIRLGRVEEAGVPLGLQGNIAGVGDLVQARRNAWHLAGHQGNRRGPVNREQYRVLDTRDDGGLTVAPVLGRTAAGERHGPRMVLPGWYVAEHVALGYACTVHAAEGLNVDTGHAVTTSATGAAALYVEATRGRIANTLYVVTRSVPDDVPTGTVNKTMHRQPTAVLAGILEGADPVRSALAEATQSARDAASIATPAELFADAVELATAGRTATWLDQLVDQGALTPADRARLAGEDGATTLTRLLRRAELAGHDPRQILATAVAGRGFDDARQITNVLHKRITDTVTLDPVGATYTGWTPQVDDPQVAHYLATLATAADARRETLGNQAATERPQWAVEVFGPVPEDERQRIQWTESAGIVAAHRELTGYDDPATALGPPPKAGQVESYASWRAAWRVLGRPDADADELQMSDGKLRMRVRAYDREQTWSPRYVANELAGTVQAAARHGETATLRAAEAQAASDPDTRLRLQREAAEASALADVLDTQAAELEQANQARAEWLVHTAETRAAADRARHVLTLRGVTAAGDDRQTTAEEWLAQHDADELVEDPHRQVFDEHDLTDVAEQRDADIRAVTDLDQLPTNTAGPGPIVDIREATAAEPAQDDTDTVRVPSAEETADIIARAQRALTELDERGTADARRVAEEARDAELARWHADDQAAAEQHPAQAEHDRVVID
jgi:conjugative relaxase-like TrwC/TraI family protein